MSQSSHVTPLPEHEARELIQKCYLHGRKVGYYLGPNRFADRLFGTVVGTGEKLVSRGGRNHKLAGRYLDFTKLRIAPTKGGPEVLCSINNGTVGPMFPFDGADAAWMTEEEMLGMARILIYSGPLPETPFWEGDCVKLKSMSRRADPKGWTVKEIDYDSPPNTDDYVYRITSTRPELRQEYWGAGLELLARGNLWKMEHGEPTSFESIEDEAAFYKTLEMSRNVTDVYATEQMRLASSTEFNNAKEERSFYASMTATFSEAIAALRSGKADEMKLKDKTKMTYAVIKYDNEEFGSRMRAHTLAKFGLGEGVSA